MSTKWFPDTGCVLPQSGRPQRCVSFLSHTDKILQENRRVFRWTPAGAVQADRSREELRPSLGVLHLGLPPAAFHTPLGPTCISGCPGLPISNCQEIRKVTVSFTAENPPPSSALINNLLMWNELLSIQRHSPQVLGEKIK